MFMVHSNYTVGIRIVYIAMLNKIPNIIVFFFWAILPTGIVTGVDPTLPY